MYHMLNRRLLDGTLALCTTKNANDYLTSEICSRSSNNLKDMLSIYKVIKGFSTLPVLMKGGIIVDILIGRVPNGDLDVEIGYDGYKDNVNECVDINSLTMELKNYAELKLDLPVDIPNIMDIIPVFADGYVFHKYKEICYKIIKVEYSYFGKLDYTYSCLDTFSLVRYFLPVFYVGEFIKYDSRGNEIKLKELKFKYLFLDISFKEFSKDIVEYVYNDQVLYIRPINQIISNQYLTLLISAITKVKLAKRLYRVKELCRLYPEYSYGTYDLDIVSKNISCLMDKLQTVPIKHLKSIIKELFIKNYIIIDEGYIVQGIRRLKEHFNYESYFRKSMSDFFMIEDIIMSQV